MKRVAAAVLPLLAVACSAAPSSAPVEEADGEVAEALRSGPRYTLTSPEILGAYASDDGCAGGFDVCYDLVVRRAGDGLEVAFGDDGHTVARAWASRGSIVFSVDGLEGDCDDPGCGNLQKITGVIYAAKKGAHWVPQVKATVVADFPYPDEPTSPEGEVKSVVRFKKR